MQLLGSWLVSAYFNSRRLGGEPDLDEIESKRWAASLRGAGYAALNSTLARRAAFSRCSCGFRAAADEKGRLGAAFF